MNWCDPCAADPLSAEELRELGVFWLDDAGAERRQGRIQMPPRGGAQEVFVTRLHLRYDEAHFPQDLVFQETGDRENYQGRYVLRHPWKGRSDCPGAREYRQALRRRQEEEARTLASLTGWRIGEIRQRMRLDDGGEDPDDGGEGKWWQKLWKGNGDEG
jgi:hypothetical protein